MGTEEWWVMWQDRGDGWVYVRRTLKPRFAALLFLWRKVCGHPLVVMGRGAREVEFHVREPKALPGSR